MPRNLYQKYRPLTFDEVLEQQHIIKSLKNSIISGIGHAYLFSGSKGTGKTSIARIFSRAINCIKPIGQNPCNTCDMCVSILNGTNLNVFEIDAASSSGVENIREIKEKISYKNITSKYKVYIIDEAHMLSIGAFNALLKMLEEPPDFVIFILASTEIKKIPKTVVSRCQKFNFKEISLKSIENFLFYVTEKEGIKIDSSSISSISFYSRGSVRDALSSLMSVSFASESISEKDLLENLGLLSQKNINKIIIYLLNGDFNSAAKIFYESNEDYIDISFFLENIGLIFSNILIFKITNKKSENIDFLFKIKDFDLPDTKKISDIILIISEGVKSIKTILPELVLNSVFIKICEIISKDSELKIIKKNDILEENSSDFEIKPNENLTDFESDKNNENEIWQNVLKVIKNESVKLFNLINDSKIKIEKDREILNRIKITIILKNIDAYNKINKPSGIQYLSNIFRKIMDKNCRIVILSDSSDLNSFDPLNDILGLKDDMDGILFIE